MRFTQGAVLPSRQKRSSTSTDVLGGDWGGVLAPGSREIGKPARYGQAEVSSDLGTCKEKDWVGESELGRSGEGWMGRGRLPVAPASRARYYYTTLRYGSLPVLRPSLPAGVVFSCLAPPRLAPGDTPSFPGPKPAREVLFRGPLKRRILPVPKAAH